VVISGDASGPDHSNTVTAVASDDDGNSDTATGTASVAFSDVAPTIVVVKRANSALDGADYHINEPGGSVTFTVTIQNTSGPSDPVTIASFTDAVSPDTVGATPAGLSCQRSDSSPFAVATDTIASGETITCTFTRSVTGDGPSTHTNTATVVAPDNDAGGSDATDSDDATVVIDNVGPADVTATASPSTINENDSTIVSGTFTDPGTADTHTVVINWGDGSSNTTLNLAAGVLTYAANHQYRDDNPTATATDTYTVTVTVSDDDGASASANASVTVGNVDPVINTITGPAGPQAKGTPTTVNATYSDVGTLDTHTCTFAWDDSTPATTVSGSGGACSATHTYATAGVYTVTLTVTDDDTGSAMQVMSTFVVIYDPGAGFVTGGGWITVAQGSCKLTSVCEGATGKANFGFVSKYKKGATVPEGQTEFQFHAGNLNFHSEAYQWLVVTGQKAQYRGTGEINGVTGYSFLLTAYDQSPDKFRIKIWRTATNEVVFDSRMGYSDDIDAASPQGISGGSIVIHK